MFKVNEMVAKLRRLNQHAIADKMEDMKKRIYDLEVALILVSCIAITVTVVFVLCVKYL